MGGGELLAIPPFLLFGGHGVDDLVEAFVGHRDAGRVESSPDFLNESLDGIGAPALPPRGLWDVVRPRVGVQCVPRLGHQPVCPCLRPETG